MDAAAKALAPGTVVDVRGDDGQDFGTGYFNPKSLIAVRLLGARVRRGDRTRISSPRVWRARWPCASGFTTSPSIAWSMPKATDCPAW